MADVNKLLNWYAKLRSRTVDLVGDYAGDELFLIDGNSLLCQVFSNEKLDFDPGFQLLHATYMVEYFLRALQKRGCKFHLVFFQDQAELCIPPGPSTGLESRCLLAREAIIQHLQSNLKATGSPVAVNIFSSYESDKFKDYLRESGTYFFMCHDGSSLFSEPDTDSDGVSDSEVYENDDDDETDGDYDEDDFELEYKSTPWSKQAVGFRSMINWFISQRYNVALIDGLECRDTKVMAMIVEGSTQEAQSVLDSLQDSKQPSPESTIFAVPHGVDSGIRSVLSTLDISAYPDIGQRDLAVLLALSIKFKAGQWTATATAEIRHVILHSILLGEYSLCDRAVMQQDTARGQTPLYDAVIFLYYTIISDAWKESTVRQAMPCDLGDLIDGRVLNHVWNEGRGQAYQSNVIAKFNSRIALLEHLCEAKLEFEPLQPASNDVSLSKKTKKSAVDRQKFQPVLFFKHPVFDTHLERVRLTVDEGGNEHTSAETSKIFKELSHWHNHSRPVGGKTVPKLTGSQAFWANKRNQFFMAEMRDYAASLTNAVGGLLQPESVFVLSSKEKAPRQTKALELPLRKDKETQRPNNAGKGGRKGNLSVKDKAAAEREKKEDEARAKQLQAWGRMKASFDKESNLVARFTKTKEYLASRPSAQRASVEAEVSVYLLNTLLEYWVSKCRAKDRDRHLHIAALIWDTICRIAKMKEGLTPEIAAAVSRTTKALGLPEVALDIVQSDKKPLAQPFPLVNGGVKVDIGISPTEFQLLHAAPFFDRNMGSAPDSRVRDFEPDEWQRAVLDEIDANRSLFVVAPTSAGKTFISFYAMKKVLEGDDDGVLVYVAPTKALVNQIAAEIQARFSKNFKHGGKSVWAIHTRDYRINNSTGCQVLVTVPHILQIMLLAPSNATSWSPRVRRIIFDEIHCIGQVDDGVVWEQLLLLAPCPIIALSATVGNPQQFSDWLGMTQKANDIELKVIEHHHRYSDLRKYVYKPPQKFSFNGLAETVPFAATGLDDTVGLTFMHPVVAVERSRKLPDDLDLEPRDCLLLWKAMVKHQTADFPVDNSLDPSASLPSIIRKVDIVEWQSKLKSLLQDWFGDPKSPLEKVLAELQTPIKNSQRAELQISSGKPKDADVVEDIRNDYISTALPLMCSLHEQGGLPAIFFNYDRTGCEAICEHVLTKLEEAETRWKKSSPAWKVKLAGWEAWKVAQEKQERKKTPAQPKKHKKGGDDDDNGDEVMTAEDRKRETASAEHSIYESFDPEAPLDGYHFADVRKLTSAEFEPYVSELRRRGVREWLITALRRGIGVHHAGMNRKYRHVCEILFRKGYLRVVIATGTLALGINMPCKTSVFAGDSIFLTALNFRQAAGRAGRRGFDLLGNVIFQGVPYAKACRLLSSRLPDLRGHFPITTSLVLRLLTLLHESKQSRNAVKMVNSLLSCPRIYLDGGEARDTVLHHLRFSIEYLRRNHLLGSTGAPLNFAGCVSHLYYVENSSFAFHALLKGGYFHKICSQVKKKPNRVILDLMLVMAHIFGRRYLRPSVLENQQAGKRSSSKIVLPRLPKGAVKILRQHNEETLGIFSSYVKTFVDEHIKEPDCNLPLTEVKCGGDQSYKTANPSPKQPVRYTSAFHALSGHQDEWEDIPALCDTVRCGVWLEKAVVPYVSLESEDGVRPINAYLYDFFKHGDVQTLERDNEIRKNDIWFLLNDFSMVLATIITSFENFLRLSPGSDDIIDSAGAGDEQEEQLDQRAIEEKSDNASVDVQVRGEQDSGPSVTAGAAGAPKKAKKKVVDSWDDEDSDDEETAVPATIPNDKIDEQKPSVGKHEVSPEAWAGKNYGILNVLLGFKLLRAEFDSKFKEMWA